MKQFVLFTGYDYSGGGWYDFKKSFGTLEEAQDYT